MSGTVPIIAAASITGITGLSKRPVYFLKLNGSPAPNLVVKGDAATGFHPGMTDADAEVSIKWGSKLMKNVNNSLVNTKIMTPAEIAVFKQFALGHFANGTPQYLNVAPGIGAPAYCWIKIPFVAGMSDAEYYTDDYDLNLKAVKQNIQKFSDAAVWTDLGKVVAVDIFNGNSDRFDVSTGNWVNNGNVMFLGAGHGHTTAVIGLDTFDPNSTDQGNLNTQGGYDAMKVLIDAGRRNAFAKKVVKSVGMQMKRALEKAGHISHIKIASQGVDGAAFITIQLATMDDLFAEYASDFEQGIATGAGQLKIYLQNKVRQYTPPRPAGPPPVMGGHRLPVAPRAPLRMGVHRGAPMPALPPVPVVPGKTIPQGIRDRMAYLGW
jgi:hypothetical protein